MNIEELDSLTDKVNEGVASEEELRLYTMYLHWITAGGEEWDVRQLGNEEEVKAELLERIVQTIGGGDVKRVKLKPMGRQMLRRSLAAAAAITAITLGVWLYYASSSQQRTATKYVYANDIAPGRGTATITLPDGKTINLSNAKTGVVIDASQIAYNDGEELGISSNIPQSIGGKAITVATPRGGTYQVVLPDGSKVWLNAASTIKFPSSFKGAKERTVELAGEAYFEVFKDKDQKFVVTTTASQDRTAQQVEVLGTHFNIKSYVDEETMKTTLLEGSVLLRNAIGGDHPESEGAEKSTILKPGQQAILSASSQINIQTVNISEAVAWKEGDFRFIDQNINDIMKQIARWYDVEVVYEDEVPATVRLNASISRNRNLSQLLKMMEKTDEVHFKIEGRKIIVKK